MGAGNPLPPSSATTSAATPTPANNSSLLKGFVAMLLGYGVGGWAGAALVGAKFFGKAALGAVMPQFKEWASKHIGVNTTQRFSGYIPGAASLGINTSAWRWDSQGYAPGEDALSDMNFEGGVVGAERGQPGYRLPPGETGRRLPTPGYGAPWSGIPGTMGPTTGQQDDFNKPTVWSGATLSIPRWITGEVDRTAFDDPNSGQVRMRGPRSQDADFPSAQMLFDAPWMDTGTPTATPATPASPRTGGDDDPEEEEPEEDNSWNGPPGLPAYTPMTFNPTFLAWQPGNTGNPQFTSGASSSSLTPEQIAALLAAGGK